MVNWAEYEERMKQRERFRKLPIKYQLEELQKGTQENDKIIGEIYIQNPPEFDDRNQLSALLGNAKLIEQFAVMGQGDNEVRMIFSINNLLIGIRYFAYWGNPFTMFNECNVYRFSEGKSLNSLDFKKIKKELFF